ncbi:MAG: TIGR00159 family protein [Deltaproteobacteria bacterium]|nr:TIGR00159 family protein [Deltaproteobacteria bacterium]
MKTDYSKYRGSCVSPLIRWQDIADIIIMSFLVYQLYVWFKHTKALQVVLGLGSLGVVYLITRNLGFFMTSWILQELGTVIFVLIIVIFQAEIRQALYRISPLRRIFGRQDAGPSFDLTEFAASIFSLAASRTGAIIAFQRTEPIDEYLANGVPLDSCVTGQLIGSIFQDGSPLHDGAMVVRNSRIYKASCHLPLSSSTDIPQHFGTRHRAALGLSEKSDSAVIVVSEERGEVSLALSGSLTRIETPERLTLDLARLLSLPARNESRPPLAKRIFSNFWPKLGTVLLVSLFWLVLTAREGEIVTVTAPVQFRNLPETLLLSSSSVDKVELQLKSFSSLISPPREGDIVSDVDLSKAHEGSNQLFFRKEDFNLPSGLVITRIKPVSLRVTIEKKIRKLVRVDARLVGTPGGRLRLRKVKVTPSMLMIEGPESIMSRTESVRTEAIPLPSAGGSVLLEKRLDLPAQLRPVYEDKVKVRVIVGR